MGRSSFIIFINIIYKMNIFDKTTYMLIAFLYNVFVHLLTSRIYQSAPYSEKHTSSVVFLIIAGLVGIVVSKVFLEYYKEYRNNVVSTGLYTGGIFLTLTALFSNWDSVSNEYKLMLSGTALIFIIWCSYHKNSTKKKRKKRKQPQNVTRTADNVGKILERSIKDVK